MEQEKKIVDPEFIYSQCQDKQRVVITGGQSKKIASLVIYVLNHHRREFDYASQIPLLAEAPLTKIDGAPLIIIQENEKPTLSVLQYHHHIALISDIEAIDEEVISQFADATPKGGTLIYSEREPAQAIGKKERTGITSIAYKVNLHAEENGKVILISSSGERFPTLLNGDENLRSLAAAKAILKKVGITSEQFYNAIAVYQT